MDEQATGTPAISAGSVASVLRRRAREGDLWVPLEGRSMLPTIEAPAYGLVGGFRRPRWGEVWAFVDREGAVTVHRVLGRTGRGVWLMRGDGNPRSDRPVALDELVGPVEALRSDAGVHPLGRSRTMALRLHLRRVRGRIRWWRVRAFPGR